MICTMLYRARNFLPDIWRAEQCVCFDFSGLYDMRVYSQWSRTLMTLFDASLRGFVQKVLSST